MADLGRGSTNGAGVGAAADLGRGMAICTGVGAAADRGGVSAIRAGFGAVADLRDAAAADLEGGSTIRATPRQPTLEVGRRSTQGLGGDPRDAASPVRRSASSTPGAFGLMRPRPVEPNTLSGA